MSSKENLRHFDIQDPDPDETRTHKWLPMASAGALVAVLGGAAFWLVQMMSGTAAPQQPRVQQISIVLPPPPPPPPPRIEEPEPEVEEMKLDEPELEPLVDNSAEAPGQDLGLDADGVAGSDAFGLKARKGGRGLLGSGDPHAWYAGVLQRELQTLLSNNESVRGLGEYAVVISLSLSQDGHIRESSLLSGTNNPELDAALRRALAAGVQLSRQPPEDLPQPIRLRITSRV